MTNFNWTPTSPEIEKELIGGVNNGFQPSPIGLTDSGQIEALAPSLPANKLTDRERERWCIAYIETLIDAGLSHLEAYDTLHAMDDIPYDDDPVDCAKEELSNYGD